MDQKILIFLLTFSVYTFGALIENESERKHRIGIFNIVKFANDPCASSEKKNGTCYTEDECTEKKGTASGSCAEGYGVCCVFSIRCGGVSSENCTYFQSSGTEEGACNAKICANSHVCQLRLDFSKFDIGQPSANAVDVNLKALTGVVLPAGLGITDMGQCLTDSFTVTSPGSTSPPVICGTNSGQHMYVDASDACNVMSFHLSGTGTRSWEIKVTQLKCNFNNLAPSGCTQYFFGKTDGTITSFNFVGGLHLASQNQNICIRREENHCQICYSAADNEFDVSSMLAANKAVLGKSGSCCGFGADGMKTVGYDCVIIPGASKKAGDDLKGSEFCGRQLGTAMSGAEVAAATVCSKSVPFQIRFLSDNGELLTEAAKNPDGFKITYKQMSCTP